MQTLDELESRLQSLLEVQLLKYLPSYQAEDRLYQHLAAAMHNNLKEQDGFTFAPNVYVIITDPATLSRWHTKQHLVKVLAEALHTTGEEAGFHFLANPTVTTAADTGMAANETHIIASFTGESVGETRGMPIEFQPEISADSFPPDAFLILGGTKIIPLNHSVINIGRRLDNQVVIDDPRVSRAHAQLRVVKGHFALFDLNSTGGTFINGKRINQSILSPGDVISLAGATLIFSQDLPSKCDRENTNTKPGLAISTDRPTVVTPERGTNVNSKARKTKKK
jgi:hypothetical protein